MLHITHQLSTTKPISFSYNKLLKLLPYQVFQNLFANFELVTLTAGEAVFEPGKSIDHLIFPTTAIIALFHTTESGTRAGIGIVGNDGALEISLLLGSNKANRQAVVLTSGNALRIKSRLICEEFRKGGAFQATALHYIGTMIAQVAQTAVCNSIHSLEHRLCRWLLSIHDRLPTDRLQITHEMLANLLGVRREGVTVAAQRLQKAGLILYTRGHINIANRSRLEGTACECYHFIKAESVHMPASVRS